MSTASIAISCIDLAVHALMVSFAYLLSGLFMQIQHDTPKLCRTAVTWRRMYIVGQDIILSRHLWVSVFRQQFDFTWPIFTKASIHCRMQRVSDSLAFPLFNCLSSVSCELVHFESCPKPQSMPIKWLCSFVMIHVWKLILRSISRSQQCC